MAINKLQGQSFGYVGVDLRIPPFTHGQLYVALPNGTEHHTPRGVAPVLDRISYSHCAPTLIAPRLGEVEILVQTIITVSVFHGSLLSSVTT